MKKRRLAEPINVTQFESIYQGGKNTFGGLVKEEFRVRVAWLYTVPLGPVNNPFFTIDNVGPLPFSLGKLVYANFLLQATAALTGAVCLPPASQMRISGNGQVGLTNLGGTITNPASGTTLQTQEFSYFMMRARESHNVAAIHQDYKMSRGLINRIEVAWLGEPGSAIGPISEGGLFDTNDQVNGIVDLRFEVIDP